MSVSEANSTLATDCGSHRVALVRIEPAAYTAAAGVRQHVPGQQHVADAEQQEHPVGVRGVRRTRSPAAAAPQAALAARRRSSGSASTLSRRPAAVTPDARSRPWSRSLCRRCEQPDQAGDGLAGDAGEGRHRQPGEALLALQHALAQSLQRRPGHAPAPPAARRPGRAGAGRPPAAATAPRSAAPPPSPTASAGLPQPVRLAGRHPAGGHRLQRERGHRADQQQVEQGHQLGVVGGAQQPGGGQQQQVAAAMLPSQPATVTPTRPRAPAPCGRSRRRLGRSRWSAGRARVGASGSDGRSPAAPAATVWR